MKAILLLKSQQCLWPLLPQLATEPSLFRAAKAPWDKWPALAWAHSQLQSYPLHNLRCLSDSLLSLYFLPPSTSLPFPQSIFIFFYSLLVSTLLFPFSNLFIPTHITILTSKPIYDLVLPETVVLCVKPLFPQLITVSSAAMAANAPL